ncbi:hypothetical protein [Microcoleus sp. N9_A1]|uniref:hypothetical protein n=1 Tax=Microcoleus sp. N9_A1 TaxID=3055380 RepID=UPI002FD1BBFC
MTEYRTRHYLNANLELKSTSEGEQVKVSYRPLTINQSVFSTSKEYVTPNYPIPEQAFIHAKGWLDCMRYSYTTREITNDNEDSYKKEYEELLENLENNRFEQDVDNSRASKQERELAYRQGWKSKLDELNNTEVRNRE